MSRIDKLEAVARQYARDLPSIADLDELLWYAATRMVAQLGFEDCVIYRIDRRSGCLLQAAASGVKAVVPGEIENYLEIPIGHGITGDVAMTGEPLIVDDVRGDPRYVADLESLRSEVTVPIILGSSVFGVIDCESPEVAAFGDDDVFALSMVAHLIAPKLESLRFQEQFSTPKHQLVEENLRLSTQLELAQNAARNAQHLAATTTLMQLSGGIAHDFNNQLAVMRGALDIASHRNQDLRPDLEMIGVAIERATQLTHRLLAFSSQQALFPHCINFSQVVVEMQSLLQVSLGSWVSLSTRIDDDLWNVNIDLGQLENAILNLAVNARDAMPNGGVLKISCYNAQLEPGSVPSELDLKPGQYVVLSVADQGQGMSAEVRSRAFEPYFTTKTRGSGTGLGLSMVYGFVRQCGGDALLTSIPGEGTVVKLYFPRDKASVEPIVTPREPNTVPHGRGERILVIEDNVQLGDAIERMLELIKYQPIVAASAQQAIGLVGDHPDIDLLLSDVVLDGGNFGPDLVEGLLAKLGETPVIFMSGYADLGKQRLDGRIANHPFLQKPFSMSELANKMREALDVRSG